MSEKRFTDDEIIKGVECCFDQKLCSECPYKEFGDCIRRKDKYAIALLHHYKAEVREQEKTIEAIFSELETEITAAIESNCRAKAIDTEYDFVIYCEGRIHSLRGLAKFIEELKKKYTEE